MSIPTLFSTITCPRCGFRKFEPMPENACVHVYECARCHQLVRPKPGDCCVFCSYGTVRCPPQQRLVPPPAPEAPGP